MASSEVASWIDVDGVIGWVGRMKDGGTDFSYGVRNGEKVFAQDAIVVARDIGGDRNDALTPPDAVPERRYYPGRGLVRHAVDLRLTDIGICSASTAGSRRGTLLY